MLPSSLDSYGLLHLSSNGNAYERQYAIHHPYSYGTSSNTPIIIPAGQKETRNRQTVKDRVNMVQDDSDVSSGEATVTAETESNRLARSSNPATRRKSNDKSGLSRVKSFKASTAAVDNGMSVGRRVAVADEPDKPSMRESSISGRSIHRERSLSNSQAESMTANGQAFLVGRTGNDIPQPAPQSSVTTDIPGRPISITRSRPLRYPLSPPLPLSQISPSNPNLSPVAQLRAGLTSGSPPTHAYGIPSPTDLDSPLSSSPTSSLSSLSPISPVSASTSLPSSPYNRTHVDLTAETTDQQKYKRRRQRSAPDLYASPPKTQLSPTAFRNRAFLADCNFADQQQESDDYMAGEAVLSIVPSSLRKRRSMNAQQRQNTDSLVIKSERTGLIADGLNRVLRPKKSLQRQYSSSTSLFSPESYASTSDAEVPTFPRGPEAGLGLVMSPNEEDIATSPDRDSFISSVPATPAFTREGSSWSIARSFWEEAPPIRRDLSPRSAERSKIPTLLFGLRLLAVIPAVVGSMVLAWRVVHGQEGILNARVDAVLALPWAILTGMFCFELTTGLAQRWLTLYSLTPTLLRLLSLQSICWPATYISLRYIGTYDLLLAWIVIGSTTACSRSIQIWVTSNVPERSTRLDTDDIKKGSSHRRASGTVSPRPKHNIENDRRYAVAHDGNPANLTRERKWDWIEIGQAVWVRVGILYFITTWYLLWLRHAG